MKTLKKTPRRLILLLAIVAATALSGPGAADAAKQPKPKHPCYGMFDGH